MMTKMLPVKVNGKWNILLPEHRAARTEWTSEGGWEKARLDHMFKTTKPGDVVYYVGAEEGDMCGLLAQWGAKLVMFEPNEKVLPNIGAIWRANKLPLGLIVTGFAANETQGHFDFKSAELIEGEMISDHGFKNLCEADGTVPMIKIDNLLQSTHYWNKMPMLVPDMISIDVEGAEWEVLRGAEKTLRTHHPRIYLSLHPEFLYEIYKEYASDLRYWLKQMGYKETLLDYQHEVHLVYEAENE